MRRKVSMLLSAAAMLLAPVASAQDCRGEMEYDSAYLELDRWYCGAGAAMLIGQGGAKIAHAGGGAVCFGSYLNEFWALEIAAEQCENATGISGGALWHWWGYERLDPFFTFGLKDYIEKHCGPYAGAGTFWHLDEHWSLRFDCTLMAGLEDSCDFMYGFMLSLRRSW